MNSKLRAYLPSLLVLTVLGILGAAGIAEANSGGTTSFTGRADRDLIVHREVAHLAVGDVAAFPPRESLAAPSPFP